MDSKLGGEVKEEFLREALHRRASWAQNLRLEGVDRRGNVMFGKGGRHGQLQVALRRGIYGQGASKKAWPKPGSSGGSRKMGRATIPTMKITRDKTKKTPHQHAKPWRRFWLTEEGKHG